MDYSKIYNDFMSKARSENRVKGDGVYYERHHIVPVCMGGKGKVTDLSHPNIVLLTTKEHFVAHELLCEIYPKNKKLRKAFWGMCNQKGKGQNSRYTPSSRIYERARLMFIESHSGENHPNFGKVYTEEELDKNRQALKSYWDNISEQEYKRRCELNKKTLDERELLSQKSKGHKKKSTENYKGPKSELHRKNISKSLTGKKRSEETKRKAVETRMRNGSYVAWNKGIPRTEEEKQKMSASRKHSLSDDDAIWILNNHKSGSHSLGTQPMATKFNISATTVKKLIKGETYKWLNVN